MIKAAFISENVDNDIISRVYSQESIKMIKGNSKLYEKVINKDELYSGCLSDTEAIFSTWGMPALTEEEIESYLPKLEILFYAAGSVRSFAIPFLKRGVKIVSAWAANAVPVAEYTTAQIILANKGFFQNCIYSRSSYIEARGYSQKFTGNYDANVGILGAGMIGRKVIELLTPFNINIYVYDPFLSDARAKELGIMKCSMKEIFMNCSTITNHMADLPETKNIINGELFDLMASNATFINTGRGAQVVEADLIKALKDEPDRTALLDVTKPEPPLPGGELYSMKNVILTSHIAGSMSKERERMGEYMIDEFLRYLKGDGLRYDVTMDMLKTMA
jgi:phosphoglycerate dehydrogenase-like enzyme